MLNDLSAPAASVYQFRVAYSGFMGGLTVDLGRICQALASCTVLPSQR